jgi:hypothetical protein
MARLGCVGRAPSAVQAAPKTSFEPGLVVRFDLSRKNEATRFHGD